jgi:pimeloyl-ACP methyl ester carboxylesterase
VSVGAADVSYGVVGSGPGLVLVHGTGSSAAGTWGHLLDRFTGEWTVVTPDLAGSGETSDPGGPLLLDDLAAQVAGAANAAGLEQFAVVGFSLGAAVAAAVAAAQPDRVSAAVLVAAAETGTGTRSRLQFELWRDLHRRDPALFARLWMLTGFSPSFVDAIPADQIGHAATFPIAKGLERQCDLNVHIDLREAAAAIRAPALVLGCTHDSIVPVERVRALAAAIEGAVYDELDCGHLAVLEAPDAFAERVRAFLRGA